MKQRGAGILMHVSSLPSRFGIGDMGPEAERFADFLADAHLHYWQILPVQPTDPQYDNSPYHCQSAFGTNPLFISPEKMVEDGLLMPEDIGEIPGFDETRVEYEKVTAYKESLFDLAYERFSQKNVPAFESFCRENEWWLDDFALFFTLKKQYAGKSWNTWPDEIKWRVPEGIGRMQLLYPDHLNKEKFLQYVFITQWKALKRYCRDRDIMIIGDLPIYVDYNSVDIWVNPRMFSLDNLLHPVMVSGVPPDYFSNTGQLWGTPVYNWEYLRNTRYSWWIKRFERNIELVDYLRIDHFRGLVAFWEVPSGAPTAMNGSWREVPVEDFLDHLMYKVPSLPLIAEDLGIITPDVREVMRKYQIPGMKVLVFAFTRDIGKNPYIFHNHEKNCVLYTGTHDNTPVRGWYQTELDQEDKNRLFAYFGREIPEHEVAWTLIRYAMMSVAYTVIIPMQDILSLGSESRMNNPACNTNNWLWRMSAMDIRKDISETLKNMMQLYGRG
jgi:4-alpha-glucanotransferase